MNVIDKENLCTLINESRIRRECSANVYLWADEKEMGISFAYSDHKNDEIILQRFSINISDRTDELWQQLHDIAIELRNKYQVPLIVDDVRSSKNISKGENMIYG